LGIHPQISVYLILAIDRGHHSAADALSIIDLAIAHAPRIVGVDICGNPTKGDVALYGPALTKAKAHGLGITVHFAETEASASDRELSTLLSFRPDRLGHVIHVPEEFKREIARRRLGLELCMSCNVHAEMIDGGFPAHHFGYWRHVDCPVVLCVSIFPFSSPGEDRVLTVLRRTMWASSVVLSRMSISWRRSTFSLAERSCLRCVVRVWM
jgi:adenosine deaminase